MKFTAQEEYGLRCLLQIGHQGGSLTIPEISARESLSIPYVAKLVRLLRQGGFVTSTRGQSGGYALARPPEQIVVGEVLAVLGGRLFDLFHKLVTGGTVEESTATELGKLSAFSGVQEFPVRVKCATLPWHTLRSALRGTGEVVFTE